MLDYPGKPSAFAKILKSGEGRQRARQRETWPEKRSGQFNAKRTQPASVAFEDKSRAASQGMRVSSRNWKKQRSRFSPRSL